jgi:NADH-quinone oxidoreductase subunit M
MIILPVVGAVLQGFLPDVSTRGENHLSRPAGRWVALATSLLSSLCGILTVVSMQASTADPQATESFAWIGSYAIHYDMAVDGLNAPLVLLISILFPVLISAEWNRRTGVRGMHGLFLVLQTAFIGAVCAQDLFLQLFFWALTAFPFYFLIGIWGTRNRESAAFRSVVTACVGNAFLLAALILIYYSIDPHTFSLHELAGGKLNGKMFEFLGYEASVPVVAFVLISIGLAFRAPIWPLHGWFMHVAEEAPLSVVVALGAAMVPVAVYIFERLTCTLFPETLLHFAPAIVVVGTINLLVGALCAVTQRNLRMLLAFICVSQVGILLLGVGSLSSPGFVGAVYQKLALGLAIAGFGLFANLLSERSGTTDFRNESGGRVFDGIALQAPTVAVVAGVVIASLLAFPGSGGFVGSSLIIIGAFSSYPVAALLAGISGLLAAYCLFTMYRYVFLGSIGDSEQNGPAMFMDLTIREKLYLLPLVASLIFFGIYPKPLIELVRPTVVTLLSMVK